MGLLSTLGVLLVSIFVTHLLGAGPADATTCYYVDGTAGDDTQAGTSPDRAWKSLQRVNREPFKPGDRIYLKAGSRWTGQLQPRGSGTILDRKPVPIVIEPYGTGPRPRIDGAGKHLDAILLRNVEFWEIRGLEVTNHGEERRPWQTGVRIVADNFGPLRHIQLKDLYVHDVNGDLRKSHEGCGIYFESRGQGCFDGLVIEGCRVANVDRNGICQRAVGGPRSRNVVIRGNLLEDIGGDGIKPWGSDGVLVEKNVLRGGCVRCTDYAAGMWPWECDGAVFQFNEVSGMKGTRDGQAFDCDALCRNTVFQYNYSHDNEGGFLLVCATPEYYCEGSVIRYNISQNDGVNTARVFHLGGPVRNTHIYNNTVYIGPQQNLPLFLCTDDDGWPEDTFIRNNIFYVEGRVRYEWGESRNHVFECNAFYGRHDGRPDDPKAVTSRPPLAGPGTGGETMETLGGYRLAPRAPDLLGILIPGNGGRDFFGTPRPLDRPPTLGA